MLAAICYYKTLLLEEARGRRLGGLFLGHEDMMNVRSCGLSLCTSTFRSRVHLRPRQTCLLASLDEDFGEIERMKKTLCKRIAVGLIIKVI